MNEEFYQFRDDYVRRKEQADKKMEEITNAQYISLSDSIQAIAYLVSLIEGKKYNPVTYTTMLYAKDESFCKLFYEDECRGVEYNIVCLINDEFKGEAEQEFLAKFYIDKSNLFEFDDVDTRLEKINNNLSVPSDYYVQLLCYKDTDFFKDVYYHRDSVKFICKQSSMELNSYICDERYSYIYDYMDSVVCYRLDKEDLEVSLEEMMKLAEEFAEEYKKSDKILKKIL